MDNQPARPYASPRRVKQAAETRQRIATVSQQLFRERGYEGTTMQEIARAAAVSVQTVYGCYGAKARILVAIVDQEAFGPKFGSLLQQVRSSTDPVGHLRLLAQLARSIYDSLRSELDLMNSAGMIAPVLARVVKEREGRRLAAQAETASFLAEHGALRHGLSEESARDVLWALTGLELYRALVQERGWESDRFERWLGDLLISGLLQPNLHPDAGRMDRPSV